MRQNTIFLPVISGLSEESVQGKEVAYGRKFAAEKIGYRKVPVIIRVLKDDEAVVSMVVII